jgi:hypothetical protein
MDLVEYGRVIRRQLVVVVLGFAVTFSVVFLALVRVSADGLALRSSPVYAARSELLVTQPSFPWGRAAAPNSPHADTAGFLEYRAGVYARLATSKTVRGIIRSNGKPLPAEAYEVIQLTSSGRALPYIEVVGKSASQRGAVAIANAVATALKRYNVAEQNRSRVPLPQRVDLRVVTPAEKAEVLQGVKLTTPILLVLLGSVVTLVFAFARDNVTRHRAATQLAGPPLEPASRAVGFESAPEEPASVRAAGGRGSFSSHARGTVEGP